MNKYKMIKGLMAVNRMTNTFEADNHYGFNEWAPALIITLNEKGIRVIRAYYPAVNGNKCFIIETEARSVRSLVMLTAQYCDYMTARFNVSISPERLFWAYMFSFTKAGYLPDIAKSEIITYYAEGDMFCAKVFNAYDTEQAMKERYIDLKHNAEYLRSVYESNRRQAEDAKLRSWVNNYCGKE